MRSNIKDEDPANHLGRILNQVLDYSWCCDSADNVQFALVLLALKNGFIAQNLAFSIFP